MTLALVQPFTAADLVFDRATHTYTVPDGRVVPSVTQILHAVGAALDFDAIANLNPILGEQIELRRQLGTVVHADCHAYDDADLDAASMDPRVGPYVHAWARCREHLQLTPVLRERIVYDPFLSFCGTLDGVFQRPDGSLVLLDLKLGDPKDAGAAYQTAGYQTALRESHPELVIAERWAVQLLPALAVPYRVTPYREWRDAAIFAAMVTTFHHMHPGRRRS